MQGARSSGYQQAMRITRLLAASLLACLAAAPAAADEAELPYWASIRSTVVNMRVGPGEDYKISWVYRRADLPLKVLRIKEGWRFVQDPDGTQGWMLARFLSRKPTAYVRGKGPAPMRDSASAGGQLLWQVAPGVTGQLGECAQGWCSFAVGPRRGYVEQDRLWGAGTP